MVFQGLVSRQSAVLSSRETWGSGVRACSRKDDTRCMIALAWWFAPGIGSLNSITAVGAVGPQRGVNHQVADVWCMKVPDPGNYGFRSFCHLLGRRQWVRGRLQLESCHDHQRIHVLVEGNMISNTGIILGLHQFGSMMAAVGREEYSRSKRVSNFEGSQLQFPDGKQIVIAIVIPRTFIKCWYVDMILALLLW